MGLAIARCVAGVATEKRKWPRLPLRLNVEFASGEPQAKAEGSGTTENVSAGGVYFLTSYWPNLKPGLKLSLYLSGFSGYNAGAVFRRVAAEGTVLRLDPPVEEEGAYRKAGVAVRFEKRPEVDIYRLSA